jgi:hypothetical protein
VQNKADQQMHERLLEIEILRKRLTELEIRDEQSKMIIEQQNNDLTQLGETVDNLLLEQERVKQRLQVWE